MPAVTELIVAELLYLQYRDRNKPMYLYINSTGTTRADGETVRASAFRQQLQPMTAYMESSLSEISVSLEQKSQIILN